VREIVEGVHLVSHGIELPSSVKKLTRRDIRIRRILWLNEQLLASEQRLRCMLLIATRQTRERIRTWNGKGKGRVTLCL